MSDWLVVLSEDNWDICRREGLIGLGQDAEGRLGRLTEGDRLWVYVNKRYVDRQTPRVRRVRALFALPAQCVVSSDRPRDRAATRHFRGPARSRCYAPSIYLP